MKKPRMPLIPITKKAVKPMTSGAPTIEQLQNEAHSRLRHINADQCRVAEILDILVAEVLVREGRLNALAPDKTGQ